MRPLQALRHMLHNSDAIVQGIANQANMINQKLDAVIQGLDNESKILNDRLQSLVEGVDNQSKLLNDKLDRLTASWKIIADAMDVFTEIQKAQFGMKRDQAEPAKHRTTGDARWSESISVRPSSTK